MADEEAAKNISNMQIRENDEKTEREQDNVPRGTKNVEMVRKESEDSHIEDPKKEKNKERRKKKIFEFANSRKLENKNKPFTTTRDLYSAQHFVLRGLLQLRTGLAIRLQHQIVILLNIICLVLCKVHF
uniref:Uncharacterized protein n=1 Tax=Heterorhabditis bacteriophora TaxID=37862 RepID=A0A1I7X6A0_HETBA